MPFGSYKFDKKYNTDNPMPCIIPIADSYWIALVRSVMGNRLANRMKIAHVARQIAVLMEDEATDAVGIACLDGPTSVVITISEYHGDKPRNPKKL